jgi:hypothetical protein
MPLLYCDGDGYRNFLLKECMTKLREAVIARDDPFSLSDPIADMTCNVERLGYRL